MDNRGILKLPAYIFSFLIVITSAAALGQLELASSYHFASWTCYDNFTDNQGDDASCKSFEDWHNTAKAACSKRCNENNKCGVDTFTIFSQCDQNISSCGDGVCEVGEDLSCPSDCAQTVTLTSSAFWKCKDGFTQSSCFDCKTQDFWRLLAESACKDRCSGNDNGNCGIENFATPSLVNNNCNNNCAPVCGNGFCEQGEQFNNKCPEDCKISLGLESYPKMFLKGNKFDGVIVVGDFAGSSDVISVSEIISSLSQEGIFTGPAKLASEVNSIDQNIISIGGACSNAITSQIKGFPPDCLDGAIIGNGYIRLYNNNGFYHLVIEGYLDKDTRAAANALANYKNYNMQGKEFIVKRTPSFPCTDSDGGIDFFVKGVGKGEYLGGGPFLIGTEPDPVFAKPTSDPFTTFYDHCVGGNFPNNLNEAYCENGFLLSTQTICDIGCKDGACINVSTCTDSDGGFDVYTKGTAKDSLHESTDTCALQIKNQNGESFVPVDGCKADNCYLTEFSCKEANNSVPTGQFFAYPTEYQCPNGCKDGACINSINPAVTCPDLESSNPSLYSDCGTRGFDKVCFNKFTSAFQGCGKSSNNDCTVGSANADKNIWCDVKIVCGNGICEAGESTSCKKDCITDPVISSIAPTSGSFDTSVTITGSGFTSKNSVSFEKGDQEGALKDISSSNGGTTITVTLPPTTNHACYEPGVPCDTSPFNFNTGDYDVSVLTSDSKESNKQKFEVSGFDQPSGQIMEVFDLIHQNLGDPIADRSDFSWCPLLVQAAFYHIQDGPPQQNGVHADGYYDYSVKAGYNQGGGRLRETFFNAPPGATSQQIADALTPNTIQALIAGIVRITVAGLYRVGDRWELLWGLNYSPDDANGVPIYCTVPSYGQ